MWLRKCAVCPSETPAARASLALISTKQSAKRLRVLDSKQLRQVTGGLADQDRGFLAGNVPGQAVVNTPSITDSAP